MRTKNTWVRFRESPRWIWRLLGSSRAKRNLLPTESPYNRGKWWLLAEGKSRANAVVGFEEPVLCADAAQVCVSDCVHCALCVRLNSTTRQLLVSRPRSRNRCSLTTPWETSPIFPSSTISDIRCMISNHKLRSPRNTGWARLKVSQALSASSTTNAVEAVIGFPPVGRSSQPQLQ